MRFTNSPFEKMMKQKPRPQAPSVLLPGAHAGPGWREVTAWPVN